jgi:hypothetical protein
MRRRTQWVIPHQGATVVYAIDGTRVGRGFAACALAVALAVAGCSLNPKTDDPNVQASTEPRGMGGITSGSGGSLNYGGLPGQVPPAPGAGGTIFGGNGDASVGAGGGPIVSPSAEAGTDAGPVDAGDAGDARPDQHSAPTRD